MSKYARILHRLLHQEDDIERVLETLVRLERKVDTLMALADDLKQSIAALDAETTAVGLLITALAGKLKNGMTDAEVADVKGALSAVADHLKALAVDPTQPVPPPSIALEAAHEVARH